MSCGGERPCTRSAQRGATLAQTKSATASRSADERLHRQQALRVFERFALYAPGRASFDGREKSGNATVIDAPSDRPRSTQLSELPEPRIDLATACDDRLRQRADGGSSSVDEPFDRRDTRRAGSVRAESAPSARPAANLPTRSCANSAPQVAACQLRQRRISSVSARHASSGSGPIERNSELMCRADERVPAVFEIEPAHLQLRQQRQHTEVLDA